MTAWLLLGSLTPAGAQTASFPLGKIRARFEQLRREAAQGVALAEEQEQRAARLAALAKDRGQARAEAVADQARRAASQARQRHLANKTKAEQALAELGRYLGREDELVKAQQRLQILEDDVAAIQFALQLYRDALLRNSSGLDAQAREVTAMSDKIILDGVDYLKDAVAGKLVKDLLKHAKKDQAETIEAFAELIEQAKTETEAAKWLAGLADRTSTLIKGADILAGAVVPGWEHVKMNAKAWATVGKECLAWREINRLNRETDQYAAEVARLSARLKIKMEEITCLKRCLGETLVGCTSECGAAGLGFPVPPP